MKNQKHIVQRFASSNKVHPSLNAGPNGASMLPPSLKNGMETAFQSDFSNVSVYPNSSHALSLNANAFAKGNEIHFAPGKYQPGTSEGKQLIGHELAHVVQQQEGRVNATKSINGFQVNDSKTLEKEASNLGVLAAKGLTNSFTGKGNAIKANDVNASPSTIIQKDDDEEGFSIDFDLLPPELRMQLWVLALDANTSRVRLSFDEGAYSGNLAYSYGGNISGGFNAGAFRSTFSVDPSSGDFNLGMGTSELMMGISPLSGGLSLSGSSHGFRYGANANFMTNSFGLNLGYGARLLPMPWDFGSSVTAGVLGLHNVIGGMDTFMDDPLAWYDMNSDDISTISSVISTGQRIAEQQDGPQFGAGLTLNYTPDLGLVIGAGLQASW